MNDAAPWQAYLDDFRARAERIPADAFDRNTLLFEAAHDSYEKTTDQLTSAGWEAERALMIGRLFGTVVKDWVEQDGQDVTELEDRLRNQYKAWSRNG